MDDPAPAPPVPPRAPAATPTTSTTPAARAGGGERGVELRLPYWPPLALDALLGFLSARAVPGVEEVVGGRYRRVLRLPGGPAVVTLGPGGGGDPDAGGGPVPAAGGGGGTPWIDCHLRLADPGDEAAAVAACRRLLDLDADPATVDAALARDAALAPLVAARPGRRAPVHVDAHELALRAVLGQQVSLAAARTLAGRLAATCGERLPEPVGGLSVVFPTAAAVAEADLDGLGMPGSRRATLQALAAALAGGDIALAPGVDPDATERSLLAVRGIGPWTAAYVRMRGLGDPDVFLPGDVGVRRALGALGLPDGAAAAERWRPWRSYAVHHLWAAP